MFPMPKDLPNPRITDNIKILLEKRYQKKNDKGEVIETPKEMFWRVAYAIAEMDGKYAADQEAVDVMPLAKKFYELMVSQTFLPNSPTLMNAGTPHGQLSACFVLPVNDSIEGIFDAVKHAAMIHKSGGGTGFSFSRLRPKNSVVGSTGGIASGPLSFLRIFNTATEQIKQGGKRRGANMGILRVDHPDIMEFIHAKDMEGEFNNFNFSVGITDDFMGAKEGKRPYKLINPMDGTVTGTLDAEKVFQELVDHAWMSGDPGVVFLDSINDDNPTPQLGQIEATNPCGEQPLLDYEACNLGSINLAKFYNDCPDKRCLWDEVDWEELRIVTRYAVHFLDNVIDANCYPLPEIDRNVKKTRKIGLGVMGWADLLYQIGIPYNSEHALSLADKVMAFINEEAHQMSMELAKKRGPFPAWQGSTYQQHGMKPLRNATCTTIAPTGTLSIIAECSSGIEPVFALYFTKNILGGEKFVEANKYFQAAIEERGLNSPELMEQVLSTGSIQKTNLPPEIKEVFVTAMDIPPMWHLKMQAVFQKHTDNAVSKTVNLPNDATPQDIYDIYMAAWNDCCKGVTVYRDGCKSLQVLATGDRQAQMDGKQPAATPESIVRQRPDILHGFTQKMQTGLGMLYVTVNELDGKPFELFATIGKSGHSVTAKTEAIGRLISLSLRSGVCVSDVINQLRGIGGEHPVFRQKGMLLSVPDAIACILEQHYQAKASTTPDLTTDKCPDCGEPLVMQEGCAHCPACGYSKCS